MEVLVAVIAFAGALLAVIATVALISRLRSEPKGWLIAWSITTASLAVSLGVIATGHLAGFGAGTFRIYQLTGSLLAPLWLAVGVIQLLARKGAARFGSWLLGIAFTVIASVILSVDPVAKETELAKLLPPGSRHWGPPPTFLLLAVHVIVALVLLGGIVLAVMRRRGGDDYDADNMHALLVLGPTGLAAVGAVSFAVDGMFTALLLLMTAAAVWYVVLRPLAPYEDEDEDEDDDWTPRPMPPRTPDMPPLDVQVAGRGMSPQNSSPRAVPAESPRRSGLGDLVAEYRAGEQEADYATRMRQQRPAASDDGFDGPATGMFMAGEYGMPPADRRPDGNLFDAFGSVDDAGRPGASGSGGALGPGGALGAGAGASGSGSVFGAGAPGPGGAPGGRGGFDSPPETGQFGIPVSGPEATRFGMSADGPATGEYDIPANEFGKHGASGSRRRGPGTGEFGRPVGPGTGEFGRPVGPGEPGRRGGPVTGEFAMPDGPLSGSGASLKPMPADQAFGAPPRREGPTGSHGYGPGADSRGHEQGFGGGPATGSTHPAGPGGNGDRPGGSGRPSPNIFGLLTVFTLLDGTGEAFDRLAEETVETVRRSEPDTLVYACHSVKSAPLQRIVYELYRDQVAYTEHQRQPHMERFVTERQPMVLATNVIELTVNAAKVVPLPTAFTL
ncbi:hypothetical protein GCM10010517_27580 [Streptosporangium fragile]|uniref:ABM domain-containing protein n=1 Tax=Streptosporangium fragile TaxID=46186 RepID=A0ABN3VXK3_9ACTN